MTALICLLAKLPESEAPTSWPGDPCRLERRDIQVGRLGIPPAGGLTSGVEVAAVFAVPLAAAHAFASGSFKRFLEARTHAFCLDCPG